MSRSNWGCAPTGIMQHLAMRAHRAGTCPPAPRNHCPRSAPSASPTLCRVRRRQEGEPGRQAVEFRVGQVMRHKRYDYR